MTTMSAGASPSPAPLVRRVSTLIDAIAVLSEFEDSRAGSVLAELRMVLNDPLRLAVVGRVKAGKSTLVNALLGRAIAPTASGECTRVVTWYRFGLPDRLVIDLRDGSRRQLPILGGVLPAELGLPLAEITRITVYLQAAALRELTLIDTPGLATLTAANESAAREALLGEQASRYATSDVDALLYVVRESEREDDIVFLRDFAAATGSMSASAINTIGVLSQADLFHGPEPLDTARRLAGRIAARAVAELNEVVAVSGLLAESARAGRVSEAVAHSLAGLAEVDSALLPAWRFLDLPSLNKAEVAQVFSVVGPYGLLHAREVARGGAPALRRWAEEESGIAVLEAVLRDRVGPRVPLIKGGRVMGRLTRLARDLGSRAALDLIEEAELDPVLHPLAELRALHGVLLNASDTPLRGLLEAFLAGRPPWAELGLPDGVPRSSAEAAGVALSAASRMRSEASLALNPFEGAAAEVLVRSFQLLVRS